MTDATVLRQAPGRAVDRDRRLAFAFIAPSLAFLLLAFVTPLVLLLAVSVIGPTGLSLDAYVKLLGTGYYLGVLWNSLRLALLTTIIALAIAYPASFAL